MKGRTRAERYVISFIVFEFGGSNRVGQFRTGGGDRNTLCEDSSSHTVHRANSSTQLTIRTSTQKHIPVYNATVSFTPSSHPNSPPQTIKLRAPFTRWFTSDGYFSPKPFQQWLASEIPIIGEADPDSVVEDIGRGSGQAGAVPKSGEFRVDASNAVEILEQLKKSASANQGGGNASASASGKAQGGGRRRKQ